MANSTERSAAGITFTGISDILLDIEGTTCPVSFVSDVLFPYASSHLREYLEVHGHGPEIRRLLAEVEQAWREDVDEEATALRQDTAGSLVSYLRLLIRQDRKLSALKELQGMIWQDGYSRGELKVHLYDDVPPTLRHWHAAGHRLSVYSSGSVGAQKLLYAHTDVGDLSPLFTAWFDTRTGPKIEAGSYSRILTSLSCPPSRALFISDSPAELSAAQEAGLSTILCRREPTGMLQQADHDAPFQTTFDLSSLQVSIDE